MLRMRLLLQLNCRGYLSRDSEWCLVCTIRTIVFYWIRRIGKEDWGWVNLTMSAIFWNLKKLLKGLEKYKKCWSVLLKHNMWKMITYMLIQLINPKISNLILWIRLNLQVKLESRDCTNIRIERKMQIISLTLKAIEKFWKVSKWRKI